jgi:hypothetical protein
MSATAERHGGTFGFLAQVGAGALLLGLTIISGTVLAVDFLRSSQPADSGPAFYILFGGTCAGILAAAGTAWSLLSPIDSAYRRGALAMVAGFATVLLMLLCIPVHQLLGRGGLGAMMAGCAVAAVILIRRARTGISR